MFDNLIAQLSAVAILQKPYTLAGFSFIVALSLLAISFTKNPHLLPKDFDRKVFWLMGALLIGFAALRPTGLARDDAAYQKILNALCPLGDCSTPATITRDYVWYYIMKLGLSYWPSSLRIALVVSALGVFIKLIVVDQLCKQRLLALLLFIPLCYVQYDLTQLRAGLAISWLMVGIYFLMRSKCIIGAGTLISNFAVHSQAIFSPGFLTYRLFGLSRWILPVGVILLLALMYGGLYPGTATLNWLGIIGETAPYYAGIQSGIYIGVKIFPWAYLVILAYGVWLCDKNIENQKITQIVSAGIFLGTVLAWFFAIIPTMQTRLFEFYTAPIIFLAGNIGQSRLKTIVTILLAIMLYLRLELLHDWILG